MEATPAVNRWDATPGAAGVEATPGRIVQSSRWDAADGGAAEQPKRNRWDATPTPGHGFGAGPDETPGAAGKRSRWDATPAMAAMGATPAYGAGGALGATPAWGATPAGGLGMETPTPGMLAAQQAAMGGVPMTPEAYQQMRVDREMDERNRCAAGQRGGVLAGCSGAAAARERCRGAAAAVTSPDAGPPRRATPTCRCTLARLPNPGTSSFLPLCAAAR